MVLQSWCLGLRGKRIGEAGSPGGAIGQAKALVLVSALRRLREQQPYAGKTEQELMMGGRPAAEAGAAEVTGD